MATTRSAHGALLKLGDGASPEVFTTVAKALDIDGPKFSSGEIDVTNHDSTAKEYIAALTDAGEMTFGLNFDANDTQHAALLALQQASTVKNWKLVLPNTSPSMQFSFSGYLKDFGAKLPVEGAQTIDASIRISGACTLAAA
jgi:hypothetical protein